MKKGLQRKTVLLVIAGMLLAALPLNAYALPGTLRVGDVGVSEEEDYTIPDLANGQVWTNRTVDTVDGQAAQLAVTLSAAGQQYTSTTTTTVPTVTVLVIDVSGSMAYSIAGGGTRMGALKTAANSFVDTVVTAGGSNYVAIVTYSSLGYITQTFTNNKTTLKNTINNLPSSGGTNIHGGLIAAIR
jgi:hypothetical protein